MRKLSFSGEKDINRAVIKETLLQLVEIAMEKYDRLISFDSSEDDCNIELKIRFQPEIEIR